MKSESPKCFVVNDNCYEDGKIVGTIRSAEFYIEEVVAAFEKRKEFDSDEAYEKWAIAEWEKEKQQNQCDED